VRSPWSGYHHRSTDLPHLHTHPNPLLTPFSRESLLLRQIHGAQSLKTFASRAGNCWNKPSPTACSAPPGGLIMDAQESKPLWRLYGVFSTPRGGCSIRCSCRILWTYGTCVATPVGSSVPLPLLSTVGPVKKTLGLGRMCNLNPKAPVQR
jgi:hypothetical protein